MKQLCRILGVFCSQMDNAYDAARLGVYLHGLAGDKAVLDVGTYGMMARDILKGISLVLDNVE